jgi:RNA polymerase sigma-70 factor (ECF subfamily)
MYQFDAALSADQRSLVDAARLGDSDAWETLYRGVYGRLHGFVARRVDGQDLEDLVNETMTCAVAGIDRFTWGPAGFDGWVFGIARRVVADHHRRRFRAEARFRYLPQPVDQTPRVGEELEEAENRTELWAAFASLPEHDREILELRVVAGLSSEAVAEALGSTPGAVRTAQSRAVGRLRQALSGAVEHHRG